jgi:hypothetical protein
VHPERLKLETQNVAQVKQKKIFPNFTSFVIFPQTSPTATKKNALMINTRSFRPQLQEGKFSSND